MKTNLTDINLVVDRSGSMGQVQAEAESGINAFLREQAAHPGEATLTLVQFDTKYEFVHRGVPIQDVPPYELVPRGMTALLDAVGRAIDETGKRLASMDEADRPGLVVFVVMTDGLENSSHQFTKQHIREKISHQQDVYNWQFTFLGANQDAFAEARALGIRQTGAANYSDRKVAAAWGGTATKIARMRKQAANRETVVNDYTEQERSDMA